MNDVDRIAAFDALYARVPKMADCRGICHDSCTVVPCTAFERQRIEQALGRPFKAIGNPLRCSALGPDGRCLHYEFRPLVCRLFGTMQHPFMKCEHGCKPERWVGGMEAARMIEEAEEIGGPMVCHFPYGWPRLTEEQARAAAALF